MGQAAFCINTLPFRWPASEGTNMQYDDTHKALAKAIMDAHAAREASYTPASGDKWGEYGLSIHEAAEKAAPAEYFEPVSCLLTAGYCEIFEWCEKVLAS